MLRNSRLIGEPRGFLPFEGRTMLACRLAIRTPHGLSLPAPDRLLIVRGDSHQDQVIYSTHNETWLARRTPPRRSQRQCAEVNLHSHPVATLLISAHLCCDPNN